MTIAAIATTLSSFLFPPFSLPSPSFFLPLPPFCPLPLSLPSLYPSLTLQGPPNGLLRAVEVDMADLTDTFMTIAAIAVCAKGTTKITNIANQRVKECNRIEAMGM
jgi:hypothetical protein